MINADYDYQYLIGRVFSLLRFSENMAAKVRVRVCTTCANERACACVGLDKSTCVRCVFFALTIYLFRAHGHEG